MEVTMKNSTKQQIMDAYLEAKQKLDAMEAMKDDPVSRAMKEQKVTDEKTASELIEKSILSPEIEAEYKALRSTMADMEAKIKNLYGIEAEANSFIAMVNAHKIAKQECEDKYNALKKQCEQDYLALKMEKQSECDELDAKKKEILATTREENNELMASLKTQREREQEEYDYNLKRSRQIENDKWKDEVAKREKEMADREAAIQAQTDEVNSKADYIVELENKVDTLTKQIDESYEKGKKDGKADADKSNAFEVRTLKMQNEYEQKTLQSQIETQTSRADKAEAKVVELQEKLDLAYAQMRQLAESTVKSSGGVKILDRDNSGK